MPALDRVELDVGGMLFATTRATLLRHPEGYFAAALRFAPEATRLFVDRSPACFGLVLDWMRGEPLPVSLLTEREVWGLRREGDFYGLPGLLAAVEEVHWVWRHSGTATARFEETGGEEGEEMDAVGSGVLSSGGVHVWHVRLDTGGLGVSVGAAAEGAGGGVLKFGCFGGVLFGTGLPRTGSEYDLAVPRNGLPPGTVLTVEMSVERRWIRFAVAGRRGRKVALPGECKQLLGDDDDV